MNTDEQRLRDALQLLAERAPATCPAPGEPGYDHSRATPVELTRSGHDRPRWRRSPALVATLVAVVLVAGAIAAYTFTRSSTPAETGATSAATTVVTCAAPPSRPAAADRPALEHRAARLGATGVRVSADGAIVTVSARRLGSGAARALCAPGALDVRPVVTAPVSVSCGAPGRQCSGTAVADAARRGKFAVPSDETAYRRLSADQQQRLAAGLGRTDCAASARAATSGSYRVACAGVPSSSNRIAYLLGTVVVADGQIRDARAVRPSANQGRLAWTVSATLTESGQERLARYTTAHNAGGASSAAPVSRCGLPDTPCGDFLGFTVDGTVVSAPLTLSPINGALVQLAGGFTADSAKRLAAELSGPLPTALRLVSVHKQR